MSNIVNLNKARKKKIRAEAETTAAANRLRFGRTKAERLRDAAEEALAKERLDQLKRDRLPED